MKRNTQKIVQGIGMAMAVGSVLVAANSTMNSSKRPAYKKQAKNAVSAVTDFVSGIQSIIR